MVGCVSLPIPDTCSRVQTVRPRLRLAITDVVHRYCTSPTSKRDGYSFRPVSGFSLRNACDPPLATSGDQPGSVVVAPRRRFDVGPRLSGVSPQGAAAPFHPMSLAGGSPCYLRMVGVLLPDSGLAVFPVSR